MIGSHRLMSTKLLADLIAIVSCGGGLDLQIGSLTTDNLVELVSNARKNSTIILRAKARATAGLVQICANAAGPSCLSVTKKGGSSAALDGLLMLSLLDSGPRFLNRDPIRPG